MDPLLSAIVDDDVAAARKFLRADAALATRIIRDAKLYESGVFHWIYEGDTALHLAAAGHRVAIVELLLAAGADPNSRLNRRQSSPLHYAADGFIAGPAWDPDQQVQTIQGLLRGGGDFHLQDRNGASPIHRAVRTRCADVVRLLLKCGANPTLPNKSGSTPVHLAVQNSGRGGSGAPAARRAQGEIIRAFLASGVSPDLRDGKGKSVRECARSPWVRELVGGDVD